VGSGWGGAVNLSKKSCPEKRKEALDRGGGYSANTGVWPKDEKSVEQGRSTGAIKKHQHPHHQPSKGGGEPWELENWKDNVGLHPITLGGGRGNRKTHSGEREKGKIPSSSEEGTFP